MKLGDLSFYLNESEFLTQNYELDNVTITTGIMQAPKISFHGTLPNENNRVRFKQEYTWNLNFKDVEWNGSLTPTGSADPAKGGEITLNAILTPYDLALGKRSTYYQSIEEAVYSLCSGFIDPDSYEPSAITAYYNQVGDNNLDYALKLANKSFAGSIPGFTHKGFKLIDFYTSEKGYSLLDKGGSMDTSKNFSLKSPKSYKAEVDLFEVNTTSSHHYGTMRQAMNIQIVGTEYRAAFEAESINNQLLEDSRSALSTTFSEFIEYLIGDVVNLEVSGKLRRMLIIGATWTINQDGTKTKYDLFNLD